MIFPNRYFKFIHIFSMKNFAKQYIHGRQHRGTRPEAVAPTCIFIHETDKVEGSLMVLFFGLILSVGLLGNLSADTFEHI